jgi:hypothetical protein
LVGPANGAAAADDDVHAFFDRTAVRRQPIGDLLTWDREAISSKAIRAQQE